MRPWTLVLTLPAFILHGCGDGSSTTSTTTVAEATTTTSSAEFGQCFPDSSIDYSNSNYLCYPASYCSEQDSAIKLGPMTLADCTLVQSTVSFLFTHVKCGVWQIQNEEISPQTCIGRCKKYV